MEDEYYRRQEKYAVLLIAFAIWAVGFLCGKVAYDCRPVTYEEIIESNKPMYYE